MKTDLNSIPIFDSLTHPTLNGKWLPSKPSLDNSLDKLIQEMESNNINRAFCVGLKGIGDYNEQRYVNFILSHKNNLYPIAFFDFKEIQSQVDILKAIKRIKELGYCGIKIHPRFSGINLENKHLESIIKSANDHHLLVFLCTYFFDDNENSYLNNIQNLIKLLSKVKKEKIILAHSTTVRVLELMEIVKAFPKILMDLSFTLCKYKGSSIDLDLKYLFRHFDQRICVGSDSPEFSLRELRKQFSCFAKGIPLSKAENIAFKNLCSFAEIN